ncbi:LytR/AlgR family response regulator transcription factor [Flectobacillus major]|uniref:LytR/AlgR family response regulator transcription factor n=1 Tax=Flectobacillus major TaxID=103 RepID=UPI0005C68726|nr:LytTR family DNA-binding domain-containing protein [Flectobacillus major]
MNLQFTLQHEPILGKNRIPIRQIVLLEGDINYTYCYLGNGRKLVFSTTLKHFESLLCPYGFLRIHRAYIINPHYLLHCDIALKSVHLVNGMTATISRRKCKILSSFTKKKASLMNKQ